jgi:AcrR family transcriptional regulator
MSEARPGVRSDALRNRVRVLEAAREAFAAEGLAVPLDEIARRAGVGAGTVYRHFPSKEALFEAVVLDRVDALAAEARELAAAADPGAAFFAYFTRIVGLALEDKALRDVLGSGLHDNIGTRTGFGDALGALLRGAQDAGAVRSDVDAADVRALIAGCLLVDRQAGPGRGLVRVAMDGLRA